MALTFLRRLSDSNEPDSFANRMRASRFRWFESLVASLPRPMRVLDVGGTSAFWKNRGWTGRADIEIVTVNLVAERQEYDNVIPTVGDATDLRQFADASFDCVFSNSVIEHLFSWENQRRMASEIQRVSKAFWVQTPNYWFPLEPHFHTLGWQWLPVDLRVALLRQRRFGWRGPSEDELEARKLVTEIRLLTRSELKILFPHATLLPERFLGVVKSWIAVQGLKIRGSNGSDYGA
jgi:hypothetical protein